MKPVVLMTDSRAYKTDKVDIIHLPFIEIEELPVDYTLLSRHYDWLILTSKNAVDIYLKHYSSITCGAIAVIGEKTAQSLYNRGISVDFIPSEYHQESFIRESQLLFKGKRVLLPCSQVARPLLYNYLAEHAVVDRLDLYRPVINQSNIDTAHELLNSERIDYMTFMSPSAVNGYFSCYNEIEVPVIAIGPVTGEALRRAGQSFIMTEQSTKESLIQKIFEMRENNEV